MNADQVFGVASAEFLAVHPAYLSIRQVASQCRQLENFGKLSVDAISPGRSVFNRDCDNAGYRYPVGAGHCPVTKMQKIDFSEATRSKRIDRKTNFCYFVPEAVRCVSGEHLVSPQKL